MHDADLSMTANWVKLERPEYVALQQFQCAAPWPKVPGGNRKLPHHPREHEWHAQRGLRNAAHVAKGDDEVWVLNDEGDWLAAMHLRVDRVSGAVDLCIESAGVSFTHRGEGCPSYGDSIMVEAETIALSTASPDDSLVLLTGWIHDENAASQRMALRNGMEPTSTRREPYQQWVKVLRGALLVE